MAKSEVFVDTSAVYALLVARDDNHRAARDGIVKLRDRDALLVTSSFVVLESVSLLQARVGMAGVQTFNRAVLPALSVIWVDGPLLNRAMGALLAAAQRRISLTDWTSFAIMRERGIGGAFAFDDDFVRQGFDLVPRV